MNGTLLRRVLVERFLTEAERQAIPEKPRRPAAAALCEGYAAPGLLSTRGSILGSVAHLVQLSCQSAISRRT